MTKSIDPSLMRSLLDYAPESGTMTWKERDMRFFSSPKSSKSWRGNKTFGEFSPFARHETKAT